MCLAETTTQLDAYASGFRGYRNVLTEGKDGDPTPAFSPNPTFAPPFAIDTGMFERLDELVKRIRVAPAYPEATGELLGIIPQGGQGIARSDVKPEITLTAAVHGYLFAVVVNGRYDSDMWEVWVRADQLANFQLAKTSTGKSTDVGYNPGAKCPPRPSLMFTFN